MQPIKRSIGLSLGADLCWPICYEGLMKRLDLKIPIEGQQVEVGVDRVTIEPFDLQQRSRYDVVIDRLTHWYHPSREWIKKEVLVNDLYVLNNPWSIQSMEKQTSYCAMMRLGMPVPKTWLIPPKAYDPHSDLEPTLHRYAQLFSLEDIGEELGYPLFMKPYDGGAWVAVNKIDDHEQLLETYNNSGTRLMHLQEGVSPFDLFVRCLGVGPQVRVIRYEPDQPLHDRYRVEKADVDEAEAQHLRAMTLTINTFFGWDFNSCEALRKDGVFYPIDFANACPDSQVTSLHYHFPWLVTSMLKWSVFCAVTQRRMHRTLDWDAFYEISDREGLSFEEKLGLYGQEAERRLEADRFEEFCESHLGHLDEVAHEFFGTEECRDAVHQKVASLFPEHEVDSFTDLFWERVQQWRTDEAG